ncbi:MAG: hypothetical protein HY735_30455 [Verrucomicrobia bacterium]|nr:hypothetical protein [Verrucomicrobiota bacterium]
MNPRSIREIVRAKERIERGKAAPAPVWEFKPDGKGGFARRAVHGKLILRSSKQTKRTKALAFALECERAEKLAGAGSLTEAQARKIEQDIMERSATGEVLRNHSIAVAPIMNSKHCAAL